MHTTIELLDAARAALGGVSDYRLAQVLGVNKNVVSNWRAGHTIGNDHALAVGRVLEIDPVYVIACASAERAPAGARQEWSRVAGRFQGAGRKIASLLRHAAVAGVVLGAGIFGAGAPSPAEASADPGRTMSILSTRRRVRPPRKAAGAPGTGARIIPFPGTAGIRRPSAAVTASAAASGQSDPGGQPPRGGV